MKNYEQLIALLEKKNLSDEEKSLLNKILNADAEAREFYNSYKKLGSAFSLSKHLTVDELSDYILIKNRLEPSLKENAAKIPMFDSHIRRCGICANEMKKINKEFSEVENFVTEQFQISHKNEIQQNAAKSIYVPKFSFVRYAVIGAMSAAVIIFSLLIVSNLTASKYYDLAVVADNDNVSISRGRTTEDFEQSIKALEEKDFQSAIIYLQNDINANPSDETIFYSYYILGLTYLESSEKSFYGLFSKFDKTTAELALKNLEKSIELNNSGKFQNVNLDAYFYAAKAWLMLEDKSSAIKYLYVVVNEKGGKMNEAAEILQNLK